MKTKQVFLLVALLCPFAWTQDSSYNFPPVNELPVIEDLPDPFKFYNSEKRVATLEDWAKRREEMKKIL